MNNPRFAVAALAFATLTAMAAASDGANGKPQEEMRVTYNPAWTSPMIIDARPRPRGFFASVGEYLAKYKGREMEMREILIGAGITDTVSIWAARQNYLIKGRTRTSRFDVDSDSYGIKWVVKPPTDTNANSLAVELEVVRPGTATARTSSSFASFNATKNNRFAVNYGLANGLQTQLSYTSVKGAASGNAGIVTLGAGKDLQLDNPFDLRLQGQLFEQSYTDVLQRVDFELKTMLYAAVGYRLSDSARIELDGAFFPSGMPLSSGRFTGLSSFQIYRPGGVAEGLRRDAIGFASLRLVLSGKF
jgi:hypothetical protein